MIRLNTPKEAQETLKGLPEIGFVPTMGALHEGHAALMRLAAQENKNPVLSVFVNPLQFGPNEDLDKYPKQLENDLNLAEKCGIKYAFLPNSSEFTEKIQTKVQVLGPALSYEGEHRPGHFDGVATIVLKLFMATRCHTAYFGLKDLQQCAVVRRMVNDLDLPVELKFVETIREPSGLALSSRNQYLSPQDREEASLLYNSLQTIAETTRENTANYQNSLRQATQNLRANGFHIEYLDLVNPHIMAPTTPDDSTARIVVAARFRSVRLIDNLPLHI